MGVHALLSSFLLVFAVVIFLCATTLCVRVNAQTQAQTGYESIHWADERVLRDCARAGVGAMGDRHPALVVDRSGVLVQLPFTHVVPFARSIAHKHKPGSVVRRHVIENLFQKDVLGGPPLQSLDFSFDIVW